MNAMFMEQVQTLIHKQSQINNDNMNSKYSWLIRKRPSIGVKWISIRDEYKILQLLRKISDDQKIIIMKKLINWVQESNAESNKVVDMCFALLNNTVNEETVKAVNLSRMASFRNSLRRLSKATNKIVPFFVNQNVTTNQRRSVTFNGTPTVYRIS